MAGEHNACVDLQENILHSIKFRFERQQGLLQEGFARVAAQAYTTAPSSLQDLKVHLTNASIQGADVLASLPSALQPPKGQPDGHTKLSLTRLWELLADAGIAREQIWPDICHTVLAALFSAQDAIPSQVLPLVNHMHPA